ncbi:MAG TPA: type II toxin-antitoxin system PemK/MazF family toxin [Burkholderiales bacterium]|jgi:mRNA interferase MazF|nr:type II toxin-antitoxin system PemK/MazF family toxin [Burkholderiales bacterium]
MPPTTGYSFGDIVLVPFPFTDQTGTKRRPAVVVSSRRYHTERPDVVIMAVTSQMRPGGFGEVSVKEWKAAGLLKASVIKPVLATIDATLVVRTLGQLKDDDQQALRLALKGILG